MARAKTKTGLGWPVPKRIVAHVRITRDGSDAWTFTEFKRFAHTHHFSHDPSFGAGAAMRAKYAGKWMTQANPDSLLSEAASLLAVDVDCLPADSSWFVPIFGGWDGVGDAILCQIGACGAGLDNETIADVLQISVREVAKQTNRFLAAGLIARDLSLRYAIDRRAPWAMVLVLLLEARRTHFPSILVDDEHSQRTPTFCFDAEFRLNTEALRKIVFGSAAATIALAAAASGTDMGSQGLADAAGVTGTTLRTAISELTLAGLVVPVGRQGGVRLVNYLVYRQQIREFFAIVAELLSVAPPPEGTYDETFRDHITAKRIGGVVRRAKIVPSEAEDVRTYPPDRYTALVVPVDGAELADVRTFDGQLLASQASFVRQASGGFGAPTRSIACTVGQAYYEGRCFRYGNLPDGKLVWYAHLARKAHGSTNLRSSSARARGRSKRLA